MSLPVIIGSALAGGVVNWLSAADEREDAIRRANEAALALEKTKITDVERNRWVDRIGDVFNYGMMEGMNENSIGLAISGAVNTGPVRSAYAGKVMGQKLSSIAQTEEKIDLYNKDVEAKAAMIRANVPQGGGSLTDFVVGATGGLSIGLGASMLGDEMDWNLDGIWDSIFGSSNTLKKKSTEEAD